jgi:hypothetical protein
LISAHFFDLRWPKLGPMNALPLQFLMLIFAGWVNRHQQDVIEYLQEENRALREQLGGKRLRFTDQQRRRLAAKAKVIGRKRLFEIGALVTPDTLFRWHRELIAKKYDGSKNRRPGRPRTAVDIEELVLLMARDNPRNAWRKSPPMRSVLDPPWIRLQPVFAAAEYSLRRRRRAMR